jgi:hypothetical protein
VTGVNEDVVSALLFILREYLAISNIFCASVHKRGATALCYFNVKCSGALPTPIYPERATQHNGDRSCSVHHLSESPTKEDLPAGMYTMMYRGAGSSETQKAVEFRTLQQMFSQDLSDIICFAV